VLGFRPACAVSHCSAQASTVTRPRSGAVQVCVTIAEVCSSSQRWASTLRLNRFSCCRPPDGRYVYDGDGLVGIWCMDRPRRTPAEQTDLVRQLIAVNPLLDTGRPVAERHDECAAWPAPPSRPEP
jgi:hypothetical protein